MVRDVRPRRSMLYMPGSNARALEKGRDIPADALILDLEDAVAPDAKATARAQVVAAVGAGGYGARELLIRTNGLTTDWGVEDVIAAATSGADAVLLPKVESAETVRETALILKQNGAPENLAIWCMIETPRGVLRAEEIADAHPRLAGFVMGTSDLTKDLQARHTPDRSPLLASLSFCLLAARASGISIVDGVHLDLNDDAGFRESCRQGVALGFDGKSLIHPKQVAGANEIFAPSADDIAWSNKIIAAHAEAVAKGAGVVVVDGRLVENLHVANARRIVTLAERIAGASASAAPKPQS